MHDFILIINLDTADVARKEIILGVVNSLQFHESLHADFSPVTLEMVKLDNILIWGTIELQSSIIQEP